MGAVLEARPVGAAPPGAGGAPPVRVEALTKDYGRRRALDAVSLTVEPGEVFGYLGPNGAGKTTTLRVLLGFLRPTAGTAQLFGVDSWSGSRAVHRHVGYVAGDVALYERMTAGDLLRYLGHLRGDVDSAYVQTLAERLDLELDRPVRALSKGNRQKVAIVQALMGRPRLLVLDEPTSGLDPLVQQQLHEMLREHAAGGGSVLLSSHVLSEVQRTADRVGMLRGGRLVAVERLDDLRKKSLHHVEVHFTAPVDVAEFRLDGVRNVEVSGDALRCASTQKSLDALLHVITRHEVVDLSCEEASLEDTFLAYYGNGNGDAA
jgi:ABC-2 type transport system ATP-binding protein